MVVQYERATKLTQCRGPFSPQESQTLTLQISLYSLYHQIVKYDSEWPNDNVAVNGVRLIGPRHCKTVNESTETNLVAIVAPQPSTASFPKSSGRPL